MVIEPSVAQTINILHGLRKEYEAYHKVKFDNHALEIAATLAEHYISDRFFPDKAIDLIDEAGLAFTYAILYKLNKPLILKPTVNLLSLNPSL